MPGRQLTYHSRQPTEARHTLPGTMCKDTGSQFGETGASPQVGYVHEQYAYVVALRFNLSYLISYAE